MRKTAPLWILPILDEMKANQRNEELPIDLKTAKNLFVEHREAVRLAFARAVRDALRQHKLAGNPIASWENGRVAWISPEDIKIDEEI
jgi:hypothetical protein